MCIRDSYNNPNNIFVAEFIGNPKMNIFNIKKNDIINKNTFKFFEKEIKYESLNFENGLYVGIRPEDISLEKKSELAIQIKVDLIENLGFEKIIYTKLSVNQIIIKSSEDISNQPLKISFSKDKVLFFDKNKNRIR